MEIIADVAKISMEQIDDVLACKIGSLHFGIEDSEQQVIFDRCQEQMQALKYE